MTTGLVDGAIRMFSGNGAQEYDADTASNEQMMGMNPYSISAQWTESVATLAGSIKVQISTDRINWTDLPDSSCTISGAGNTFWEVSDAPYMYVRLYLTISSGTISISAVGNFNRTVKA